PDAIGHLREAKPDYLFILGWSQICGAEVMGGTPGRVVGYHPAALPRQRGRAAIPWTILNREPITAGSLFWIDDGVDTGAILDQQYFHVAPRETAASLYAKHMAALATMFDRSLAALAAGTERREVQDDALATWCAKRTAEDGLIDWTQSARDIDRLVRAVGHPYPGAFTTTRQERIVIWSAHVIAGDRHAGTVGQLVSRDDSGFAVMCGDGDLLQVTEWSSETMRPPALHQRLGVL
ncbi:MAG: methionyl-tRNA formyltransferase, partial [Sphingobium sp.]